MKRIICVAGLVAGLATIQGCAAVALTAGGIAGGAGVEHTLNGIGYKTFAAPLANVRLATLKSLHKLDIKVSHDHKTDDGWQIDASALDREIDITLEAVTHRSTRMRVVVNKGDFFFKDAATGNEIIIETASALAKDQQASR
jgi:Protein of unknown function (DUF3568)